MLRGPTSIAYVPGSPTRRGPNGATPPDALIGCICLSQGALAYPDPGTPNTVICTVPLFDPDGNLLTVVGCTNNYVVLPR